MATTAIKAIVIDDHTLFRKGIEALLKNRDVDVVASVNNGRDGISKVLALQPDIVLLDLRMHDINGIDVVTKLRNKGFDAPVVMLTMSHDEKDLIYSIKQGASGYLLKDMDPDDLVAAMRRIHQGECIVTPTLQAIYEKMQDDKNTKQLDSGLDKLTPRERETLELLAKGLSNKRIASKFNIVDGTVKLHVKSILRKLRVHSRVEAAVIAIKEMNRKAHQ